MLSNEYNAVEVEELDSVNKKKFTMLMPPPNITGILHLGHAMMISIQDLLCRYYMMNDFNVCWVPGTDHAGIATQTVIEQQLKKEFNINAKDLTRDELISYANKWNLNKSAKIFDQIKRLGAVCDWSKQSYTLSDEMNYRVNYAFTKLFDDGLIYRTTRLVNWCCYLNTALSDIEVDHVTIEEPTMFNIPGYDKPIEFGYIWTIKYQIENEDDYISVSTTRPETILGDVAVAVNPNDHRYEKYVGKNLIHPFFVNRKIPIIADSFCDMEYGTGAVKITPGHDINDYDVGVKHKLDIISIFDKSGYINKHGGQFESMHRFDARDAILKYLESHKLLLDKSKNTKKMVIPVCSRSGDIIEYMNVPQWYLNCNDLSKAAINAVKCGELEIMPKIYEKIWYNWLENSRDWCISRQLWWGHQIPVYTVLNKSNTDSSIDTHWIAAVSFEEAQVKAKKMYFYDFELIQDNDVLDTWFSSALLPFCVFGWPDNSKDFNNYFPTTLLETGKDILFFWVARMVMLSICLTKKLPFTKVYLHPIVRDSQGKKMSKSLGNALDPIDIIYGISLNDLNNKIKNSYLNETEQKTALSLQKKNFPQGISECGADALRYALLSYLKGEKDINLNINKVISYHHFCNKIWNASKYILQKYSNSVNMKFNINEFTYWSDQWIIFKLRTLVENVHIYYQNYQFSDLTYSINNFFIADYCDVYLELTKHRFAECFYILYFCMQTFLKILHPLMPFITEELYSKLNLVITNKLPAFLRVSAFPNKSDFDMFNPNINDSINDEVMIFLNLVKTVRSMLAQYDVKPSLKLDLYINSTLMENKKIELIRLCNIKNVIITNQISKNFIGDITTDGIIIGIDHEGKIDFSKVYDKLTKKYNLIEKTLETLIKKLGNNSKLPEQIRIELEEKHKTATYEITKINDALQNVKRLIEPN